MTRKSLKILANFRQDFLVLAEFVPLPGQKLTNFEAFLRAYAEKKAQFPAGVELAGVTIPQSPSGAPSLSPADIYAALDKQSLWGDLDVIPHVTCKDHSVAGIRTYLMGLQKLGIESVLALTGDKPAESQGVFEIDSVGLIGLIKEMNAESFEKAKPGQFDQVHQFYVAAAVSPFKYTEAAQMQQYYKMGKKLRAGADCLIAQLGWDWRKSEELFRYLQEEGIRAPVFGNVYVLTTLTPAPRLMFEGKLPGCLVTRELFDKVRGETLDQQLERAAQQMAMYRALGAVGADVGGLADFDMLLGIVRRAEEIGADWRQYQQNLAFGAPGGFYLYDEQGRRRPPSPAKATLGKRQFDLMHRTLLTPGKGLHGTLKKVFGASKGMREGKGWLYKLFFAGFEAPVKKLMFDCEECGDCFLVENFGLCSLGKCEKGLDNPPCGDANADGTCGNNVEIRCVGELIYEAAASEGEEGLKRLAATMNPRRNAELQGTASILNYLWGRDHAGKIGLIQIGESLHASIPRPGAAMRELLSRGVGAHEAPSGALEYLLTLIRQQVKHGADYLEINVDAFGEDDPRTVVELMRQYVRLVRRHGGGVPVCIDSSSDAVLEAGLEEWYQDAPGDLAWPLLNSVKTYTVDRILPWRKKWPFKVIGLLVDDKRAGTDGAYSVDDLHGMARTIFEAATSKYGFAPGDLFFDSTVFPLAIDMPMTSNTPGYTYRAFEAIRQISSDPVLKGVHKSLGISNAVRDLPGRRIGACRAYLAKAMEYGLDAAIVNVMHDYGLKPVAADLLELVDAFAKQDGVPERAERAMQAMSEFCRANRKAAAR